MHIPMDKIYLLLIYIIAAPLAGGLMMGIDRKITARMQRRYGPPLLQPFYDVLKLFSKENLVVRRSQNMYIVFYLLFMVFTGALFFTGGDLLLVIFSLALAGIFLVLAGYKGSSPYSHIGAERELLQMMAYEPMVLLTAVGMYMVTRSFSVGAIANYPVPLLLVLPGIFIGLIEALTIKLRKSPFDLATSHHGHQEIVKGVTVEYSGSALAMIELAHWYETALLMGLIYLFWAVNPWIGVALVLAAYFLEIWIDNAFARFRWEWMLKSTWGATLIFGVGNIIALMLMRG